jgi:hypothetical protein
LLGIAYSNIRFIYAHAVYAFRRKGGERKVINITEMPAGFLQVFESTGKTYRIEASPLAIELVEEARG